jgi:hypothetical protein
MKNNFVVLACLVASTFSVSASELGDKCFKLKEVMETNNVGRSYVCLYASIGQCFFTDDKEWYTRTFQIPCRQFKVIERIAGEKNISSISIKVAQKDID